MKTLVQLALALAALCAPISAQVPESPQVIQGPQASGKPGGTSTSNKPDSARMTNDSVLRMHAAGLSDDLIIQTIKTQPGEYSTDADTLIALKKSGLSDDVLTAMANKARRQITNVDATGNLAAAGDPPPIELSPVNEIGVYYKDKDGRWTPMDSEIVHIKSGGFLKSTLTHGIVKEDRNGVVSGTESKLLLPRPIEFLIYAPDGVTASEYELLAFRLNGKDREFRVLTGGVIHSTGGAQRDDVAFTPTKIAPHTWTFTLGPKTPGAEYGILPPGTGNVTNGGKIYTFAISE
jgi:hypothetical protein